MKMIPYIGYYLSLFSCFFVLFCFFFSISDDFEFECWGWGVLYIVLQSQEYLDRF